MSNPINESLLDNIRETVEQMNEAIGIAKPTPTDASQPTERPRIGKKADPIKWTSIFRWTALRHYLNAVCPRSSTWFTIASFAHWCATFGIEAVVGPYDIGLTNTSTGQQIVISISTPLSTLDYNLSQLGLPSRQEAIEDQEMIDDLDQNGYADGYADGWADATNGDMPND